MRITPRLFKLFVTPLMLLVGAHVARAQDLTRDRVQYALDQTDRHIEQAQTLLAGTENATAESEVTMAVDLQARAKTAFAASDLRISMSLTLQARGHADRAISIMKGLPDPDRVKAQLERTRELIERARDRIEECQNPRAHALLRVAFEMQTRAEAAASESRYLAALQLTLGARERAYRALRLCNLEENLQESAERALARTDELITRASEVLADCNEPRARDALGHAQEMEAEAHAQFRLEHFEASLRLTQSARALAHRAIRLCQGGA